jgi:hypothetical protein
MPGVDIIYPPYYYGFTQKDLKDACVSRGECVNFTFFLSELTSSVVVRVSGYTSRNPGFDSRR